MTGRHPLEDIRVVDFGSAGVGALVCKMLGDLGAEVIRIESQAYIDTTRRILPFKNNEPDIDNGGAFCAYNTSKYGITLNLNQPKGIEIVKMLIARANLVSENFSPKPMRKWGLDYENLKKVKPDIIMISLSAQGQTGPHSLYRGFGWGLQGMTGLCHITGWPDRGPMGGVAHTDCFVPPMGVVASLAAIDYWRRTGKGQYIDLSQYEASIHYLGTTILDYTVNEREQERMGNRHSYAAPHGAYRCRGEDRWCVIAVFTDEEWAALCKVIGSPMWAKNSKFATTLGRKESEDELDALLEEWTTNHSAEEVMNKMQAEGVTAAVVKDCKDLFEDPQLNSRHHYQKVDHLRMGEYICDAPPFRLSKTSCEPRTGSPLLGQHNEYVYKDILGMTEEEYCELLVAGVFD